MKRIFIILIFLLITISVYSQIKITGIVKDSADRSVNFATITMLTTDSTFVKGEITDSIGCFTFNNINKGEYILSVSCIGYYSKKLQIFADNIPVLELDTIILQENSQLLNEVVVNGSSFIQKRDHLLVVPGKEQKKHAYTGYDLLYNLMIPGVTVNRKESIVTTARGVVTLYINGVEADFREIQNLRPKDIERVEYFSIPSGKYIGNIAAVNYIVKQYNSGGYVSLDGEQTLGYLNGKYNLSSKMDKGTTHYSFFAGCSILKYNGENTKKNEFLFFPENNVFRYHQSENGKYSSNIQYAQFKLRDIHENRDLSMSFAYVRNCKPHDDRVERLHYTGVEATDVCSSNTINQKNQNLSLQLSGTFRPKKNQEFYIGIKGSLSKNNYNRLYTENVDESHSSVKEDYYYFNFISRYGIQMRHNNSFDVRVIHNHNITSSSYRGDYANWQHLWMGETQAYMNYSQQFDNGWMINIDPGISVLNYKVHGKEHQNYSNFRTNSWLLYRFNDKHYIGGGGSVGSNWASLKYLNTSNQSVDFLQIKRGNPDLDNSKYYSLFLVYEGQFKPVILQLNSNYSMIRNGITPYYYIENNKMINSFLSNANIDCFWTELQTTSRFSSKFRILAKIKYQLMNVRHRYGLFCHTYVGSIDINYFFKNFSFNIFAKTPEQKIDDVTLAYLCIPGSYGLIIRYTKNNFMCEVGTDSPFTKHNRYRENADYGVYRYNQVSTSRINQQTAYLKLAYTFDFGKKTSREKKDINTQIDSAILKAE